MLTKDEVAGVLADMDGQTALLTRLLCGIGRRLMEGMRLRIKNADFDRRVIVVREAKVGKDRVVMLPRLLAPAREWKFAVQRGEVLYLDRAVIVANVQLKTEYGVTASCCT